VIAARYAPYAENAREYRFSIAVVIEITKVLKLIKKKRLMNFELKNN